MLLLLYISLFVKGILKGIAGWEITLKNNPTLDRENNR
jgi:hypothetical protein